MHLSELGLHAAKLITRIHKRERIRLSIQVDTFILDQQNSP